MHYSNNVLNKLTINSGGVVVRLLACRTRGPRFDSQSRRLGATISEIGYLLLPSRNMAEILLNKATHILKTTNQPSNIDGAIPSHQLSNPCLHGSPPSPLSKECPILTSIFSISPLRVLRNYTSTSIHSLEHANNKLRWKCVFCNDYQDI